MCYSAYLPDPAHTCMGRSRAERRRKSGAVLNLFSTNTTLGWIVECTVSFEMALEKVALRKWRFVYWEADGDGELAGVQALKPEEPKAHKVVPTMEPSRATITLDEMRKNAGLDGGSATAGMQEWKRERRQRRARVDKGKIVALEDGIERAIEKVKQWPFPASRVDDGSGPAVFGDRAVRVYPKASRK